MNALHACRREPFATELTLSFTQPLPVGGRPPRNLGAPAVADPEPMRLGDGPRSELLAIESPAGAWQPYRLSTPRDLDAAPTLRTTSWPCLRWLLAFGVLDHS